MTTEMLVLGNTSRKMVLSPNIIHTLMITILVDNYLALSNVQKLINFINCTKEGKSDSIISHTFRIVQILSTKVHVVPRGKQPLR